MKQLLLLFSVSFLVPTFCTEKEKDPNFDEIVYNWSRSFAEIMQLTDQKHYKPENAKEAMIKACDSFLNTLDPHSNMLDPKTYKNMLDSTSGEFFGIGVVIDNTRSSKDKTLLIIDTIPDGPSDKEGVKPLDKIVEVDGQTLDGMSTDEIMLKLKGERGSKVTIKILRENHPDMLTFTITRDVIKEQNSLCFYIPDQNVYYLSLSIFSEPAARTLETLLNKAHEQKAKALILDLRNNSGGLLSSAVDIAGLFLDKGSLVVTTKDKHGKVIEKYNTRREPISRHDVPVFVLINNFTASAGEILAGCLKIHAEKATKKQNGMVFLVGSKTFGKGSVQEVVPISNNCAIKITSSLYFLPNDTTIQGVGITPDFEVERQFPMTEQQRWFTQSFGREKSYQHYIKVHEEPKAEKKKDDKDSKAKTWAVRAQKMLETDNQLRQTITLSNLLSHLQQDKSGSLSRKQAVDTINKIFIFSDDELKLVEVKV